jgi:lysophospholipase L1-like esterase
VIEQLLAMYDEATRAGIRVVAGTIVPYNTATTAQNDRMREINEWIRRFATDTKHVDFADTRSAVAAPDDPDRLAESPDGLHPSPDGYKRMADAIESALRRVLRT